MIWLIVLLKSNISLLIFFPFFLSITERGLDTSSYTWRFVRYSRKFCQICILYVKLSCWCINIYDYRCLFLINWLFFHYEITLFLANILLKSTLSDINVASHSSFLLTSISKISFFYPFTLSWLISLYLRTTYRQLMVGSCFFMYYDHLWLLIGLFMPFTFNEIADIVKFESYLFVFFSISPICFLSLYLSVSFFFLFLFYFFKVKFM